MRDVVGSLRSRFQECRRADVPLSAWRELQLEILSAVKKLRRTATVRTQAVRGAQSPSHTALWAMMGDAFWIERDPARLARMLEEVIAELEKHAAVSWGDSADL